MSTYQTVEKTFRLIELLADRSPLGVSELAGLLDLEKSGVSRLMKTLCNLGYAVQEHPRGPFQLGPRFLYLSDSYLHENRLVKEAQPLMDELAAAMRASVHLAACAGRQILVLAKTPSPERIQVASAAGAAISAHASALGKALLAPMKPEERLQFLKLPLHRFTENTITDQRKLDKALQEVMSQGYALEVEEEILGVSCIGAGVRDNTGTCVAALSVSGPMQGTPFSLNQENIDLVIEKANELSKRLGFQQGRNSHGKIRNTSNPRGRIVHAVNS